jgi:hypothetical protein
MQQPLSALDQITIASPCPANWVEMAGDDRTRFCSQCKLHIYDLSAMSRSEAEAFVREREGRTCVRYFRRQDGTVLTRDCPVGLRAVRQRFTRAVAALAGMCLALISGTLFGGRLNRLSAEGFRSPSEALAHWVDPEPGFFAVGELVCPNSPLGQILFLEEGELIDEPAETPLLPPTAEQQAAIQQRLAQ